MDVPWCENIPYSKRLDGSAGMIATFFCIEQDINCEESVFCKELSTPYAVYFEDTFNQKGIRHNFHLSGIKTRIPTAADLALTCQRLNICYPNCQSVRDGIIRVFHYLSSFPFTSNDDIESFCLKHALGFFTHPKLPFHHNIIAFRNFLSLQVPIKLSVVDGQH